MDFRSDCPLSDNGDPSSCFCYVDDGGSSVSAFQTYLGQYRSLFCSLTGPARLVSLAAAAGIFHAARVVFESFHRRTRS